MNAAEVFAVARVVLLDFDGPITLLMPPPVNAQAADATRAALRAHVITLPDEIAATTDHLAVLRWTGSHAPTALRDVERAADDCETQAARTSRPTAGAHDLIAACHRAARPVVIVSNNAAGPIWTYLDRYDLAPLVLGVIGRPPGRPDLMKPHPHTVLAALDLAHVRPADAVLVGDSVSDVVVSLAVGVRSIGYAKTPSRGAELAAAGAHAITDRIAALVESV